MNDRDRNIEMRLERLIEESRASLPHLEPDPGLPARVRAMGSAGSAGSGRRAGWPHRRWVWASFATAAVALSIFAGGYVGYHLWAVSQGSASEPSGDSELFASVVLQSGFADDIVANSEGQP